MVQCWCWHSPLLLGGLALVNPGGAVVVVCTLVWTVALEAFARHGFLQLCALLRCEPVVVFAWELWVRFLGFGVSPLGSCLVGAGIALVGVSGVGLLLRCWCSTLCGRCWC